MLNQCGGKKDKPCWCDDVVVPNSLIDLLPLHLKGYACICCSCIELYNEDQERFKSIFLDEPTMSRLI